MGLMDNLFIHIACLSKFDGVNDSFASIIVLLVLTRVFLQSGWLFVFLVVIHSLIRWVKYPNLIHNRLSSLIRFGG